MEKNIVYEIYPNSANSLNIMNFHSSKKHTPLHWHENLEILYTVSGERPVTVNGRKYIACDGDCVIVNKNELHEMPATQSHYVCIMLPASFFGFFDGKKTIKIRNFIRDIRCKQYIDRILEIISGEDDSLYSELKIFSIIYDFFAYLVKNYQSDDFDDKNTDNGILKIYMDILKYILEHYAEDIMIDDLCKFSHINKQTLQKEFKQITGTTVKKYIVQLRIKNAYEMLAYTDKSITEIAFLCGLNDSNYFARIFKKYTGQTPSEVRRGRNISETKNSAVIVRKKNQNAGK